MTVARIVQREELIFLLNQAAELEHSLCCSYLFTAFSLKSRSEDGLPEETVAAVQRWKRVFNDIAIEEMMHLAVINDLLVSIGSAPNLDRPNFPHGCSYYMPDLHIELHAFGEETMRHFIAVEQPTGGTLPTRVNPELVETIEGSRENEIGPDPYHLASQGDVYDLVLRGLREMVERIGAEKVFIGPPATKAQARFLQSYGWEPVRDLATAEKALAKIVEQGEGGSADSADSHHFRFASLLDEYLAMKSADPSFEPAFPVLDNPFARTPPEAIGGVNVFDNETAVQISDLFNETYTAMLQLVARFHVTTDETEKESAALSNAALEAMIGAVVPLGDLLVRMPAGRSQPGFNAGPSFVVRTLHPLPHKDAAWVVLRERFEELRDHAAKIASSSEELAPLAKVAEKLDRITRLLTPVAPVS